VHFLGVDIGSASTKIIAIDSDTNIVAKSVVQQGTGTIGIDKALNDIYGNYNIKKDECANIVATGYGRLTFESASLQMSEITCHAKGIKKILPNVHTIIDIGGQDSKAIHINDSGIIQQFVMNDKCAAGTGRFLEVMSRILGLDISELGPVSETAQQVLSISSTCTVFAESEVISRLSEGKSIPDIIAGIHQSVAKRVAGLTLRVGLNEDVTLTGGVAKNIGIISALEKELKVKLVIPPEPQITGALGAALIAFEKFNKK